MPDHPRVLERDRSLLLVIDFQESYRGKLHEEESALAGTSRLLDAAAQLGLPVVLTEQYPRGLGSTREELAEHLPADCARFEKTSFSALGAHGALDHLRGLAREQVVVAGIETHVCVSQTVHALLAADFQPHVVRDAVTARFALEHEIGFAKMIGSGAVPATVEAVLFEWLRDSRSPDFKAIQKLVV